MTNTATDIERSALAAELLALEREARELSYLRRRLHERIDRGFPNDLLLAEERHVSGARRELHTRIDLLRAQLSL